MVGHREGGSLLYQRSANVHGNEEKEIEQQKEKAINGMPRQDQVVMISSWP
jgi:hypothetical protein